MQLDFAHPSDYFWALLPEIVLSFWGMMVLVVDVFQKGREPVPSRPYIPWLSLAGLVLAGVANTWLLGFTEVGTAGIVAVDGFRVFANFIMLVSAAIAILISIGYPDHTGINRGEFFALILLSTLVGWWACTVTAAHMRVLDPGPIVWDEVIAFWALPHA